MLTQMSIQEATISQSHSEEVFMGHVNTAISILIEGLKEIIGGYWPVGNLQWRLKL